MIQTGPPLAYADANREPFVAALRDFIKFPSVSARPEHHADSERCAQWLANHLREIGMEQVGFGLPDDRLHAPNEKFHLPNFHNGIATIIQFLAEVSATSGAKSALPRHQGQWQTALAAV